MTIHIVQGATTNQRGPFRTQNPRKSQNTMVSTTIVHTSGTFLDFFGHFFENYHFFPN